MKYACNFDKSPQYLNSLKKKWFSWFQEYHWHPQASPANSRGSVMKRVKTGQAFRSDHLVNL